jgi:hypothetical protein
VTGRGLFTDNGYCPEVLERLSETMKDDWTIRYLRSALFWDITHFLTLEDGTRTLSRNVGKGLPHDAA